jgi:hypothetical protein
MITIDEAVELLGRMVRETGYPLELPRMLRGGARLHDVIVGQGPLPDDYEHTEEMGDHEHLR